MDLGDLKTSDLFVVCDKCNGSKNITETQGGTSYGRTSMSFGPCDKCNGAGGHLTEAGRVLKDFIQRVNNHQI